MPVSLHTAAPTAQDRHNHPHLSILSPAPNLHTHCRYAIQRLLCSTYKHPPSLPCSITLHESPGNIYTSDVSRLYCLRFCEVITEHAYLLAQADSQHSTVRVGEGIVHESLVQERVTLLPPVLRSHNRACLSSGTVRVGEGIVHESVVQE